VELRKKTRDEQVMKRRMKAPSSDEPTNDENSANTSNITAPTAEAKLSPKDIQEKLKNLPTLVQMVNSEDQGHQLAAVTEFRKLLSIEKNPPIQDVINTGVIPRLVQMLANVQNESLQFEAAWTLTNVASGTTKHTEHIIQHGAIQSFVALLGSPNADVREQAVWALGNIAGDSATFRDYVIQSGGVPGMLSVFNHSAKVSMLRNATWALSNLCRGKPQPAFEHIQPVLPTLAKLVAMDDPEIITDACWALSYISDDSGPANAKIQAVVESGIAPRLVQLLNHHNATVQIPALRSVGNIVTGDDHQTEAILACNPLPFLVGLLSHKKKNVRKEACWTISNITAGNETQIQLVLDANLIPPLVCLLREAEFDIQKEAAWAISNATSGGSSKQNRFLVQQGALPALCNLFSCTDPKVVMVALEAIDNILKVGKADANSSNNLNSFCEFVEECGGLDALENLQRHDNEEIYDKSIRMLRDYFESEEEEDGMTAPVVDGNQFAFGLTTGQQNGFSF
jgi:HEAT repeat protein